MVGRRRRVFIGLAGSLSCRNVLPCCAVARGGASSGSSFSTATRLRLSSAIPDAIMQQDAGGTERVHRRRDIGKVEEMSSPSAVRGMVDRAVRHFLPAGAPASVGRNYASYAAWSVAGSVMGTASFVLSTQQLLFAVGLGSAAALPLAASINWILKDGLGQLGGILVASKVNTRFDAEPRRWRMISALAINGAIVLESATPFFPGMFLLAASAANVAKNVGWMSASATKAAIHASFARRQNLADITGKAGAQSIGASVIGTALGIGISGLVEPSSVTMVSTVALLCCSNIFCLKKSLELVVVRSLNGSRAELALSDEALSSARVSDGSFAVHVDPDAIRRPNQVAEAESLLSKSAHDIHLGVDARDFLSASDADHEQLNLARKDAYCLRVTTETDRNQRQRRADALIVQGATDAQVLEVYAIAHLALKMKHLQDGELEQIAAAVIDGNVGQKLADGIALAGWDIQALEKKQMRITII